MSMETISKDVIEHIELLELPIAVRDTIEEHRRLCSFSMRPTHYIKNGKIVSAD